MIAKLKGTIDELKATECILDVSGVGYHLSIPISTYEKIKDHKDIILHVYTLHKEDQLRLFGFFHEKEKKLFSILLNISGIGPAMALSILSGISIDRLIEAVQMEDPSLLVTIPGIGKSKAEKLIFELKRKIKKLEEFSTGGEEINFASRDAIDALSSLGYNETQSSKIVSQIMKDNPDYSVEDIIKEALKVVT